MAEGRRITAGRMRPQRAAVRLTRPLREFLETETAGGIVLLIAVVVAMAWANSPWKGSYEALWHSELAAEVAGRRLTRDLQHWVNDGLMVIFFFVVGLEIKREIVHGDLGTARKALLPTAAAIGGMVVPALVYLALNPSGIPSRGWGIPMATDIAFALGVLALLGRGMPSQLRVLLLSLAIVDDVGAILVIAIFYSESISWVALGAASALAASTLVLRRLGVWWVPVYVAVGTGVWLATLLSGIHATIAGVALGLLTPAHPLRRGKVDVSVPEEERGTPAEEAMFVRQRIVASIPVVERLEHALHPWTSFVILPIFALANAGVPLGASDLGRSVSSTVTVGVVLGLVLGKGIGISAAAWVATRLGASLPRGVRRRHVMGVAALAGIGFTMSLFIGTLAFADPDLVNEAKVGIVAGSVVAAVVGGLLLRSARRADEASGD